MTRARWVDDALRLPLGFAQVREDPWLDLALLDRLPQRDRLRVIMVASGGCTAAALAATGRVTELTLVDVNPAQLALTQLKLALLGGADPEDRLALLGHARLDAGERERWLGRFGVNLRALGPRDAVMELGPDHAGRYERVFAEVRKVFAAEAVLDDAFERVMSLENLQALFGAGASQGTRMPFARHFASRTYDALARPDRDSNPFLGQVLRGAYPEAARAPWLDAPRVNAMPRTWFAHAPMAQVLSDLPYEQHFVHLSNTLDWLSADDARVVLEQARAQLVPSGWLIVRQLNSVLDIPALLPDFGWDPELGRELHARDRSFFYHAIHVGYRR